MWHVDRIFFHFISRFTLYKTVYIFAKSQMNANKNLTNTADQEETVDDNYLI